jgi:plasmid stabilization system protein ParE
MKYRVHITAKAEEDAEGVLAWFHENQATAAGARWFAGIMAAIDTLESHPMRCRIAPESEDIGVEIRQLLFGKRRGVYRVYFLIKGQTVYILRIRHGAMDRLKQEDLPVTSE